MAAIMGAITAATLMASRPRARERRLVDRLPCTAALAAFTFLWAIPEPRAAEWKVAPTITLNETYSDNISLAPSGFEDSDLRSQIVPGLAIHANGARIHLNLDYQLFHTRYLQETRPSNTNHQLDLQLQAKLTDNFFIDSFAAIRQQNVSLLGRIGDTTDPNLNSTSTRSFSLSPYVRYHVSDFAEGEIRYTDSFAGSNQKNALSNSHGQRADLSVSSGRSFDEFRWNANYSDERIDYRDFQDTKFSKVEGTGRYRLTRQLALLATLGYEKNDFASVGDKPEGALWNLGFSWAPSNRTRLEATAGRRFFGNTYAVDFSHRRRSSFWTLGYDQNLTTTRSQFFRPAGFDLRAALDEQLRSTVIDSAERRTLIDSLLAEVGLDPSGIVQGALNFLTNRAFLQKRFHASVLVDMARGNLYIDTFDTVRDAKISGTTSSTLLGVLDDFSSSLNVEQKGVGSQYSWALSPRTRATLGVNLTRNIFRDQNRTDDLLESTVGIMRTLKPGIVGSVQYRYRQRDTSTGTNQYIENALLGTVRAEF
jgi:uncharacterized protein (PEP-CTERM system associated)